ncbi:MAG TPA: ribulose-phosphate 3-epimerase [bacterium]|nr:ribulose-phosphate 3-epimerase [bacterium]HQL62491.1 ribulose-phosphate 3-epimerase [bacterium]
MKRLQLHVGIKTDPIEYRYSYEWLFRLLAEEGIHYAQLGTFHEIYSLPDEYFLNLKKQADDFDVVIYSVFCAHREMGGFFREEPGWDDLARRDFRRLIEVGAVLGAASVGSNAGSVLRDRMGTKPVGIRRYVSEMKQFMHYAKRCGVPWLTVEPMSCLAEPPTLPEEIQDMAEELIPYHRELPDETSMFGYCSDVSHGYADRNRRVRADHVKLLTASFPYLYEIHLKNTDECYDRTFGFSEEERKRGIIQIDEMRDLILAHADEIPVDTIIGYFEISGPKLGRDYSDSLLEANLRESLRYLRDTFVTPSASVLTLSPSPSVERGAAEIVLPPLPPGEGEGKASQIEIAPSMMCADLCHFEESVRRLEREGIHSLHFDMMDAHFVPNMPVGLDLLRQIRTRTDCLFDVHLMVENNDFFIEQLAHIGVSRISVHAESAVHLDRTLALIREKGMKAGVALNPATPPTVLSYILNRLDFVLVLTVNPGFSAQIMVPFGIHKIADCRAFLDGHNLRIPIQVDGNVSFEKIPQMVAAGADILVGGTSSVFSKTGSIRENIRRMRDAVTEGLQQRSRA